MKGKEAAEAAANAWHSTALHHAETGKAWEEEATRLQSRVDELERDRADVDKYRTLFTAYRNKFVDKAVALRRESLIRSTMLRWRWALAQESRRKLRENVLSFREQVFAEQLEKKQYDERLQTELLRCRAKRRFAEVEELWKLLQVGKCTSTSPLCAIRESAL